MADLHSEGILDVRTQIDKIDANIVSLLQKRINLAQRIGRLKDKDKRKKWDPQREREIYRKLLVLNEKRFPEKALLAIFHEIITACRLSQHKISIAFYEAETTFCHFAGVKYFGHTGDFVSRDSIEDIFADVTSERVHYGIVPMIHSIEGCIAATLASFDKYRSIICGEILLPISYNLVCQSGNIEDIQFIAGDSQALSLCRRWLLQTYPSLPVLYANSGGDAVKMATENTAVAAIASSLTAKINDLQTVTKGIEDITDNVARFFVIGKNTTDASGMDKTTLLLGLPDQPGALHQVLTIIQEEKINLVKIESSAVKNRQWKYQVLIDMEGHIADKNIKKGCDRLKKTCLYYKWLGSYPAYLSEF